MCLLIVPSSARSQGNAIRSVPVTENIHMLMGKGGNIGLFVGADGAFLIDDKYAPLGGSLLNRILGYRTLPKMHLPLPILRQGPSSFNSNSTLDPMNPYHPAGLISKPFERKRR